MHQSYYNYCKYLIFILLRIKDLLFCDLKYIHTKLNFKSKSKPSRSVFPFSPASHHLTVSQVQVHQGRNVSTLYSLISFFPPRLPPSALFPCSVVTAWRYYDTGVVVLLWQQAGWPGYVLVKKDSLSEIERETPPLPQQLGTVVPLQLPPRAFQTPPRPWEHQEFHIHHPSHTPCTPLSQPSPSFPPQPTPNSVTHQFIQPIFKMLLHLHSEGPPLPQHTPDQAVL